MEDWTQYREEYPIYTDTIDKIGRPIAEVWISDWNIRRALMVGRGQKLLRWNIHMLETQQKRVFEIRRDGNQNVTGAVEIMDFQGFNAWNQGCPPCLPVFLGMLHTWVKHYGGTWDNIYVVNSKLFSRRKKYIKNYKCVAKLVKITCYILQCHLRFILF